MNAEEIIKKWNDKGPQGSPDPWPVTGYMIQHADLLALVEEAIKEGRKQGLDEVTRIVSVEIDHHGIDESRALRWWQKELLEAIAKIREQK